MNKLFVKKSELSLVNGGYLVATEKAIAVFNKEFVTAQKEAEYLITLAGEAKGKDFKGKQPDNFEEIVKRVRETLSNKKQIEYIETPKAPVSKTNNALKNEALAFIEYTQRTTNVAKLNNYLSRYDIISEFEEFGLYFDDTEIVKLNKIYTIEDIKEAALSLIDLL
ncbi:MAG: hypothetical protein WC942_08255 [Clostridia bacterium]|jgi:hypothetical protein